MTYDELVAALCIWREARGEPYSVKAAVGAVLVNRMRDAASRWPKVLHRVVLQPKQFSSFSAGDPNSTKFPLTGTGLDWVAFLDCQRAVGDALVGIDPVEGANHYYDVSIPEPSWADPAKYVKTVGKLRFYRL